MKSDYEFLKTEVDGHILTVTINRPEVYNALHPPSHAEFDEVWNEFDNDPNLWVGIVTGEGEKAFSAGNDLKYQAQTGKFGGDMPASGFAGLTNRFDLNKPLIAAVNGVSMGGGFEIALACDIIIASENAKFALPEPKVGLAALAGGMQRLPRQIGMKNAMGMMLTGRHVPAEEAKTLGCVNEVVAHDKLMETAKNWAKLIEECSPMSIRATKQVAYANFDEPNLEKSMQMPFSEVKALFESEDFLEGPVAFAEKRLPNWKGK